ENITTLIARFGKGGLSAKDAVHIIRAGFFGAGLEISESEIAKMQMGTTPLAALELATELLEAAFLPL
ncbi:MAG: GTA-gp10 family protein, partial [Parvibaculales bacterium]